MSEPRESVTADGLRRSANIVSAWSNGLSIKDEWFDAGGYGPVNAHNLELIANDLSAAADALAQSEQRRVELEEALERWERSEISARDFVLLARNLLSTHSKEELNDNA